MSEAASTALKDNEYVKELLSILKDNGKNASSLTALIGYISSMENQLNRAGEELQGVIMELNTIKDERNHPLRTALQDAAQSMDTHITEMRTKIESLKETIVEGCKQAVDAFKEKGITALNSIASFFKIKPALQTLRSNLKSEIKRDQAAITKIKDISTQYHKTSRSIRNFGRVLRGKKPITGVVSNGKLAALLSAPFQAEIKYLADALKETDKAITALTRLEKAVPKKTAARREGKPSLLNNIKKLQAEIDSSKRTAPVKNNVKSKKEAAL